MSATHGTGAALYLTPRDDPSGILAGKYYDEIGALAAFVDDDTLVQINHEPNAPD